MRTLWTLLFVLVAILGCGGSGSSSGSSAFRGISIQPLVIALKPNDSIQLTAVVDGGAQGVVWSLPDAGAQGSFGEPGKYKAPAASGDYKIRVALASDPTKFAEAIAKVDSGYAVNVTTSAGSNLAYGASKAFSATVAGAASNSVIWSVDKGSITESGDYTAPSGPSGTDGGTFTATVKATSTLDSGKSKVISLTIAPPIELIGGSAERIAMPLSRLTFAVKVAGVTTNTGVNWTASSGSITSAGVWTAAANAVGNLGVTATLASDPTKSITIPVRVYDNLNVRFKFATAGDIVLALRPDQAPRHCANLVSLVTEGFYTGIRLHRREEAFVVQWGCPFTKTLPLDNSQIGTGGPGYSINFEPNSLLHTKYSLGMARSTSRDSAGSQIYICLEPLPSLDTNYVVFGSVLSGQSAVDAIQIGDTITSATVEVPSSL